jgi:hypothetical protein
MKALLKTGETIEIVPNDDFCAAKYINKETSEYVFNDEIVEIINEEIMAKYIDVDLLRKEIERLRGIGGNLPLDNREQKTGYESALIDIETFLDSIESEKPMNMDEELNEEIKKEMAKLPFFIRGKDQIAFARHFAEWGAEHLKK